MNSSTGPYYSEDGKTWIYSGNASFHTSELFNINNILFTASFNLSIEDGKYIVTPCGVWYSIDGKLWKQMPNLTSISMLICTTDQNSGDTALILGSTASGTFDDMNKYVQGMIDTNYYSLYRYKF